MHTTNEGLRHTHGSGDKSGTQSRDISTSGGGYSCGRSPHVMEHLIPIGCDIERFPVCLFVCLFATRHNHIMVPRRCGPIRSAHVILGDITSKSCSFPVRGYGCQYAEILPARHLWLWSCLERLLVLPKPRHNMAHDASRDDRSIATKNHQRPPDWRWP